MDIDFFGLFSVNIWFVLFGFFGVTLITLVIAIISLVKSTNMKKKYIAFMEGSEGQSIEDLIKNSLKHVKKLDEVSIQNEKAVKDIYEKLEKSFHKIGIIRYDAFHEMGGRLSFALCLLNNQNDGFLLNVMYGNDGCFAYIKKVSNGNPEMELGEEEKEALSQALSQELGRK